MTTPSKKLYRYATRVWIVDDEPISRFIMRRCIPDNGEFVIAGEFDDGQKAMDKLKSLQHNDDAFPDVIILDVNMPLLDGWEFMELFQDLFKKNDSPKVFIVSSSEHEDDIARSHEFAAIEEYLLKPISMEVMERVMLYHFQQKVV